jgi:hypothetical protein
MGYWDVVNKPRIAKRLFGGKDYDGGGTLIYGFTNLMVILCIDSQNYQVAPAAWAQVPNSSFECIHREQFSGFAF